MTQREKLETALHEACLKAAKVVGFKKMSWFGRAQRKDTFVRDPVTLFGE